MFHKMDDNWPRKAYFRHYLDNMCCTYSLTVQIDITKLHGARKANGIKAYPAQIYMLAAVVNQFPAFRMGMTAEGEPGIWEIMHPFYTVFNPKNKCFSSIWTPFHSHFPAFYAACMEDIEQYKNADTLTPKPEAPPNAFHVSSVPWVDFTAFNLNVYSDGTHLAPIFTIGKYVQEGGRTFMPLAMQLHHAACDGYHAGQFIEALRDMAQEYAAWL